MTSSRLEGLVVRAVGSCLGDCSSMGIFIKVFGSGKWGKKVHMVDYGQDMAV